MDIDEPADIVARLPLLGPVIGWTRPTGRGLMRSRLWACLDGYESETPLAMMTVGWDRGKGVMLSGSVRLWRLDALRLHEGALERRLHIGLADVFLPIDGHDYTVRVVALHRCIGRVCARGKGILLSDLPTEEQGGEGWRPRLASGRPLLSLLDPAAPRAGDSATAADSREVVAADWWPQPQSIDVAALIRGPRSRHAVRAWLDDFARQALQALAQSEGAIAGLERARAAAATTPLRKARHRATMAGCAAAPGPAVRASMKVAASPAASPAARTTLRFAAGCCRYPGTPFERDRADATLAMLAARAKRPDGPAFAVFSGDQIYADATAGVFETQGRREKVAARYESAFSTPAFRELARHLPLYMGADDHEISDGWSLPRAHAAHLAPSEVFRNDRLGEWAGKLFLAYQRMHGPPPSHGAGNWYRFAVAGVHFFMMDTRFERGLARAGAPPPLCAEAQMAALGRWLAQVPAEAPKFIVSGSVYAPGLAEWLDVPPERCRGDTWQGFAAERATVARMVAQARADNLVFLSGDYHCAAVAAIEWVEPGGGTLDLRAWSIVTPPLYAPFPFANSRADEVLPAEEIYSPAPRSAAPLVARCRAQSFDRSGFALISVTHGAGEPVALEVEFLDPFAGGRARSRVVRLSLQAPRV